MDSERFDYLFKIGNETIKELETHNGILASSLSEAYGCVFGRDSLITALKLLRVFNVTKDVYYLALTKKILAGLFALQGKDFNLESGEEPGKCVHEYRQTGHDHLTKRDFKAWFTYNDGSMKNYDSLDATPLLLIAIHRYWQASGDSEFIALYEKEIKLALYWLVSHGDKNNDGFLDYQLSPDRKSGGLTVQSWMDSGSSIFHEDSSEVVFPVAPAEVQAYAYLAMSLWAGAYLGKDAELSAMLFSRAESLKKLFNEKFVLIENGSVAFAAAIDGSGKPVVSRRSSVGHCLWASYIALSGLPVGILETRYLQAAVDWLFQEDIYVPGAGIRTLSKNSIMYKANSYHNGSIWPHDNSIISEGLERYGYLTEAAKINLAIIEAIWHFKNPVELFTYSDVFHDYCSPDGQVSCKKQAWSAAALLDALTFILTSQKQEFKIKIST